MKKKLIVLLGLILIVIIEFGLRFFLGFCNAPLYISDVNYEYIAAPNQTGERFGNNYHFNSFSQRSDEPNPNKIKILGIGDSVIYGGVQTDQDSIATSIFNRSLPNLQMLNISSGSWGPDNGASYINKNGIFNAKALFLVVSSHDANDNMDFKQVVGKHISYPNEQYMIAWWELIDRYIFPRIKKIFVKKIPLDPDQQVTRGIIKKEGEIFNPGFNQLLKISLKNNIPLTIYLHAEISELLNNKYSSQGETIIKWANDNNIEVIKELDYNFTKSDYRDQIHFNSSGQKKLSTIMINKYKSIY